MSASAQTGSHIAIAHQAQGYRAGATDREVPGHVRDKTGQDAPAGEAEVNRADRRRNRKGAKMAGNGNRPNLGVQHEVEEGVSPKPCDTCGVTVTFMARSFAVHPTSVSPFEGTGLVAVRGERKDLETWARCLNCGRGTYYRAHPHIPNQWKLISSVENWGRLVLDQEEQEEEQPHELRAPDGPAPEAG